MKNIIKEITTIRKYVYIAIEIIILFSSSLFFASCQLFSSPQAESSIVSTYTNDSDEYHYLSAVIKISNTGNKTIYQTVISLQADTNIRTYYKTTTSNLTIHPENSVFITVDFSFKDEKEKEESEKEKWIEDSVKILTDFSN